MLADDDEEEEADYTIVVEPKKKKKGGGGGCVSCGNITITVTNTGTSADIKYKVDRPDKMTNEEKALFQRCKELLNEVRDYSQMRTVRKIDTLKDPEDDGTKMDYFRREQMIEDALAAYDEAGCNDFLDSRVPEIVNSISESVVPQ